VHLWAGIVVTLYVVIIGFSGSMLVFRPEIERLCGLKPWQGMFTEGPVADLAAVVENLKAAYPGGRIVSVDAPGPEEATFVAVVATRGGRAKVACAPADGRVLGEFPRNRTWLGVIEELHETLLIHPGSRGRMWNGVGAAALLLLNVTGMVIWWPGIRNWKRALKVDLARNWRRINFDLHVAAGFWTILITSIWAVSGIYFGWPRQVFLFVDSISRVVSARPPAITVSPRMDAPAIDLRSFIQRARALDPGTALGGVAFPYGRRAPLAILMRRRNTPGYEYVDTVYFNPFTGDYISTWRYGVNQSLGDWIVWLEVPLHFGTYWGWAVKVLWAAAGLAIPLLAVTGLWMYWNRALRRKWKKHHQRQPALAAPGP
jgi:uncharacterized iron-regulated membrane protein